MRSLPPLPVPRSALVAALLLLASIVPAAAQSTGRPGVAPGLPPGPVGGNVAGGADEFRITSSSNEHGSALWVVDSIQHTVTLCEKIDTAKDFACVKKSLP
jgi:hypothetical protein